MVLPLTSYLGHAVWTTGGDLPPAEGQGHAAAAGRRRRRLGGQAPRPPRHGHAAGSHASAPAAAVATTLRYCCHSCNFDRAREPSLTPRYTVATSLNVTLSNQHQMAKQGAWQVVVQPRCRVSTLVETPLESPLYRVNLVCDRRGEGKHGGAHEADAAAGPSRPSGRAGHASQLPRCASGNIANSRSVVVWCYCSELP